MWMWAWVFKGRPYANLILDDWFAARLDGISIGSYKLTLFVLGVDRDEGPLRHLFNDRSER